MRASRWVGGSVFAGRERMHIIFILNEIYIDLKSTIEQNKNDNLIILHHQDLIVDID